MSKIVIDLRPDDEISILLSNEVKDDIQWVFLFSELPNVVTSDVSITFQHITYSIGNGLEIQDNVLSWSFFNGDFQSNKTIGYMEPTNNEANTYYKIKVVVWRQ